MLVNYFLLLIDDYECSILWVSTCKSWASDNIHEFSEDAFYSGNETTVGTIYIPYILKHVP
jgi:hypothetical protein